MSLDSLVRRNRRFLTDLIMGPFRGHGIIMTPQYPAAPGPGDFTCSELPQEIWADWLARRYELQHEWLSALDHDAVPKTKLVTGTQPFAAAFGCPVRIVPDSMPMALPIVGSADEADRLPEPSVCAPPLDHIFAMAERLCARLGPDAPISVPDMQSPLDIAALVWRKEEFFVAMRREPDAVRRLVDKCTRLVTAFLQEFQRRFGEVTFWYWTEVWAPPEAGCWVSEDEVGSISAHMFESFSLPALADLSRTFGGVSLHCCAEADHQHAGFLKIPGLRVMNRLPKAAAMRPVVEAFSGRAVLGVAYDTANEYREIIALCRPDTRLLFCVPAMPLEEARQRYEQMRALCPRTEVRKE
jgi:hypothetical protein